MKLSIAMIVKNEEKNLERTLIPLKKLQDYIDAEIIIVDTGSTDNSVDIAKKYTDKIYFHKWNSDFGSMRNLSIRYCTGDWILIVDADEELYDIEELANLINSKILKKYYSAFIKIVDFSQSIQNSVSSGAISPLLRLFKKNTVKYEGIIHEQPICSEPTLDSQIRFIHYGYDNNNYELMEHKFQRNIKLLFKELDEKPNSIYVYFQIATSYLMHKDLQKALKYIEIAYKKASKKGLCNYIYVIDKYCLILYTLKSYDTLIYKAKEGIKYCDKFIDFYFYLGEAYNNLNQYDKAIQPYEMYLDLYKNPNKNDILAEFSISIFTIEYKNAVIYHLGLCYYQNKFYEKALSLILTIDDNNFMHDKITIICKIIEDGGLWNKFYILNNFIDIHNYDEILIFLHNNVFMENLIMINSQEIDGFLKEMLDIVIYFKNNGNINYKHLEKIKRIISRNKKLYSIYVYYVLKFDINEFDFFINYGKKELKNILSKLIFTYYDFGSYLENKLNNFKEYNTISVIKHNIIMEALLNSRKLQIDKRRILFLDFLADKFYSIVKLYKFEY
ncbi:glycosyltransferase family 2 protein, partial [Clostridium sporogenes]